ncbi:isoaspartyl peptidase/L-asparaginase [Dyadobacter flavalbus]|uniref:Isoaspartyl peptidase n=1 Tax=Dyadobacter flavalbus TaxID=2579942 RepID=A0A5M8QU71_9BACT|nr:isoaspartyl peptidase/L-asparaginase [Dyadobacter flavalbus]KAA6439797.1 isoaspartyl peptidase/L-asparaginase [Dyadobacter flavalbus]
MFTIAIHGGAGSATHANTSAQQEADYLKGLDEALHAGYEILAKGGTALDAVERSVMALEDIPLFNAGRGAVFTSDEKHEMDAAVMCGKTLRAGAVSAISNIKNPVQLARTVMDKSENVLLTGIGAIEFARKHQLPFEDDTYYFTEKRKQELLQAKEQSSELNTGKGTVGAVALDTSGNLAVATSTGGLTNKKYGRVGDSPIIGSGTYANNQTCAVSCTGDGEYLMRLVAAYDISCYMEYRQLGLQEACMALIDKLTALGGEGGLIAMDKHGHVQLVFNCESMLRAWKNHHGEGETKIWQ